MSNQEKQDVQNRTESLALAIDEVYIQLRSLKRVLEEKGIFTDDDYRDAYQKELTVSPSNQAHQKFTDELIKRRRRFLDK